MEKKFILPDLPQLYKVQKKDFHQALNTLVDAFQHDPVWCALLKDQKSLLYKFFSVPVHYSIALGRSYALDSNIKGVANWLGSPYTQLTMMNMLKSGALKYGLSIGMKNIMRMQKSMGTIEKDRLKNMKGKEPFAYLIILGICQESQGQGIGSKLVQSMLDGLKKMSEGRESPIPAYLETETEKNVSFYERLGFEVIKEIKLPVIDLPMWEMIHYG